MRPLYVSFMGCRCIKDKEEDASRFVFFKASSYKKRGVTEDPSVCRALSRLEEALGV
jgi:hypothetical protein